MKILVAYDGSVQSRHALSEAVEIARRFNGSMTVLNVRSLSNAKDQDAEKQNTVSDLKEALKRFEGRYEIVFEEGRDISDTILNSASEGEFDLIAIGRRGTGSLKTILLGSVSRRVISEASCDVLVTK